MFRAHELPGDLPEAALPAGDVVHLPALLTGLGFASGTSAARRLIAGGGVRVDGDPVSDLDVARSRLAGAVLSAGRRQQVRLR